MPSKTPRVILTNDDGPPGPHSPYVFGLYRHLVQDLGWDVKVVVPSSQKSWIGKAYQINDIIRGRYYYPKGPDGQGETSEISRPLKDGEIGEWILLDGTPATCANIGLHNLYHGDIDLVISGPNFGRNTSSAFSLSSGTIGAALSSALAQTRSIALSYGTMEEPVQDEWCEPAHNLAMRIIHHLWNNWGSDPLGLRANAATGEKEVDLYSINVPMVKELLDGDGLPICWTDMWRKSYGRLFKAHTDGPGPSGPPAGPDEPGAKLSTGAGADAAEHDVGKLVFRWGPDISGLIAPPSSSIPLGSDTWAITNGYVSVTPLRAGFAEPDKEGSTEEVRFWKVKL